MVRENSDVKPVERKNAVQLLRKATLTRLNKPKDEGEPSAEVYVIDLDDSALQKAKEKYPGFIPDAEVLERGVNNKKHNLKNIKHSKLKQGSKVRHSPSNSGDSGSSKRKTYTRSRVNNIHSNLLTRKAQSHRKSKLHLNQLRLTNPFKESRFSAASGELTVQNSMASLPSPGQIHTPDPLGFLASKYDQKNEAENKNSLVPEDIKFPIIKKGTLILETLEKNPLIKLKNNKAHLRRSRSFNISNHGLNGNALFGKESGGQLDEKSKGLSLERSKSLKNLKNENINDLNDKNETFNNEQKSTAGSTFKRLLTFGKRTKSSGRKNSENDKKIENSSKVNNGIGRMKSFKWTGRKVIPEKYSGKNDEEPPDLRKDLNRSNTSNVVILKEKEHKKISLERSATTGKIGGNEMIKSFKQFFDKFSSNKAKSPSKQDQSDVQLSCTDINSTPLVHRVVIESPEVNLMPLVIQSSDSLLDDIKASEKLNSPSSAKNNNYSSENNNESPDYFFIPPKSVRRPNLTKTSNSTTSLPHSTKSGKFTRSEPNSAGLPPKNINSLEINQLMNDLAAYSQMDHIPDSPYTIPDSHSADMKSVHSDNNYNKESDIIDSHNGDTNGSYSNKGNDIYNSAFNQIISSYTTPVYNLIFQGPVRQVISGSTWKFRFLFLFEHLLVIAKSMESSDSPDFNISEAYFEIKKVISLDVINAVTARNQSNKEKSSENKYHPIILSAIRRFEIDPNAAISYLIARGLLHLEPLSISKFIYFTPELSRLQLTNYVGQTNNHAILISFLNHFNWTGLRLDLALRVLSTCLVLKLGTNSSELILDKFATRWHQANRSTTNFRSELTLLLVVSLLEIDDKGKGSLSKELFLSNVRKFDSTNTLPEHLLIDMYDSISESPLMVNNESQEKIELKIDNNFSRKIIVNEHSDSIEVTLSTPCPGLRLLAHGEDIKCDPPEIVFDSSPSQTFRIIGDTPGKKSLMFIPTGQHSSKLRFIPSLPIIVEQNFMKHAFSLSFTNSGGNKNNELNHPDIIMSNYDVIDSEDLKNQPPSNNNTQQNVKKYLFALETHEDLISWTCSFERTIDILQENQDEALQKIEDELCSTLDNSEDAFEEADKIQKSRAKDLSVALTQHFTPHFNSALYYPELIAIASKKEF